jgi:hypothetical protein
MPNRTSGDSRTRGQARERAAARRPQPRRALHRPRSAAGALSSLFHTPAARSKRSHRESNARPASLHYVACGPGFAAILSGLSRASAPKCRAPSRSRDVIPDPYAEGDQTEPDLAGSLFIVRGEVLGKRAVSREGRGWQCVSGRENAFPRRGDLDYGQPASEFLGHYVRRTERMTLDSHRQNDDWHKREREPNQRSHAASKRNADTRRISTRCAGNAPLGLLSASRFRTPPSRLRRALPSASGPSVGVPSAHVPLMSTVRWTEERSVST